MSRYSTGFSSKLSASTKCCAYRPTRSLWERRCSPSVGVRSPATRFISVDLPARQGGGGGGACACADRQRQGGTAAAGGSCGKAAPTCAVGADDGDARPHVNANVEVLHAKIVAPGVLETAGVSWRGEG